VRTNGVLVDLMAGLAFVKNRFSCVRVCSHSRNRHRGDHGSRQNPLAHLEVPSRFALSNVS
jgi:hypothetical protein